MGAIDEYLAKKKLEEDAKKNATLQQQAYNLTNKATETIAGGMDTAFKTSTEYFNKGIDKTKQMGTDFMNIFKPQPSIAKPTPNAITKEQYDKYYDKYLKGVPTNQWKGIIDSLDTMDKQ
jgi:hypothetical protein